MSTIHDVAEKAGVSIKTVSRVLNDASAVSEKTRLRIEQAMRVLDFAPSAAARMLRGKPTDLVAVIAERMTTAPDSAEIMKGFQLVCDELGKMLLIAETGGHPENAKRLVADMRERRVEAIMFATPFHMPITIEPLLGSTPIVLANCFEQSNRYPQFVPDDEGGGYAAAKLVLNAGHKKIALLQLIPHMVATDLRFQGFLQAMSEHGVTPRAEWIQFGAAAVPDREFEHLQEAIDQLFSTKTRPTAILCGNDKMAMRTLFILQKRGLRVPEDVSIVGFDDFRLISEALDPGLTTIALPYRKIGELAAREAFSDGSVGGTIGVPCVPVERGTVAKPPQEKRP
jgi:LacI family transcriptional regulator